MKKIILLAIVFVGCLGQLQSQNGFDYNNRHLSQSTNFNPAFLPQYKLSVGFGNSFEAYYPGFNIGTFYDASTDAITTIRNIINDPNVKLNMSFDNRTELMHVGFKSKNSYFSFNSSNQTLGQINLPKDLLGIAMFGNQEYYGKKANFDFSGTEFMSYLENKFTYGRNFGNKLSLGVSYSNLNGLAHADLKTAYGYIETDTNVNTIYQIKMGGAFDAQTSLMGLSVMKALNDSNYNPGQVVTDELTSNPLGYNKGSAWGFGFVYRANSKVRVSAAVNNIGKINWNLGAEKHHMSDNPWTFTGLDTGITNDLNNVKVEDVLMDSLSRAFDNHSTALTSYTTQLHQRYTLGLEYFINPRAYMQFTYGSGFGVKGDKSFAGVNIHKELGEWIDVRLSYSLYDFDNAQHTIGVGMSLNLGPIQPWLSLNNLSGITGYDKSHYQSVRFGLNINIGQRKDSDGDGVRDKSDSCHLTFGARSNNGCELGYLGGKMDYSEPTETDSVQDEPLSVGAPAEVATTPTLEVSTPEPVVTKKTKPAKVKKQAKKEISLTDAMRN